MNLVDDVPELPAFLKERVQYYLRDVRGYAYDEVNAVLSAGLSTLHDAADRVEAIHHIRPTEDFEPVAASFKRIKNILKQAQVLATGEPDPKLLAPGPEQELYRAFVRVAKSDRFNGWLSDKLEAMASLRPQVDLFFDKILVNDPNPAIRQNRLALLQQFADGVLQHRRFFRNRHSGRPLSVRRFFNADILHQETRSGNEEIRLLVWRRHG